MYDETQVHIQAERDRFYRQQNFVGLESIHLITFLPTGQHPRDGFYMQFRNVMLRNERALPSFISWEYWVEPDKSCKRSNEYLHFSVIP